MRHALACLLVVVVLGLPSRTAAADLPPVGRSLFDHLTSREVDGRRVQRIPYPLQALLADIERHAGTDTLGRPGVAAVLIPLGRSLQRNASPGHYFEHPRVVVAVTGESRTGAGQPLLLKDKLFLGFQDEAAVIEVISYNERAGRFEFQIVTDYRPGGSPQVLYARRALCTACHHGGAPIFSRPSWDETNANPAVARALAVHASAFHGVAVARGVDLPNSIDDSVARANRIALVQTIWRDGCRQVKAPSDPIACRQAVLLAALEWRLRGMRASDPAKGATSDADLQPLLAAWKATWTKGLAEADPNIANRDPFLGQAQQLSRSDLPATPWGADEITPALDPIVARAPVDAWHADARGVVQLTHTLAGLLAQTDIERMSRRLEQLAPPGERQAVLKRALAALADDTRAGHHDVLGAEPFRRAATVRALFRQLGIAAAPSCCDEDAAGWPPARLETGAQLNAGSVPENLQPFYRHCAACHDLPSASPPGFLHGTVDEVERNLRRCAPRIRFRLQMWQLAASARPKVPMPPPVFVPAWAHAPPHDDIERMLRHVSPTTDAASGGRARDAIYEALPACREPGQPAFEPRRP